jgi:hypothetical protein
MRTPKIEGGGQKAEGGKMRGFFSAYRLPPSAYFLSNMPILHKKIAANYRTVPIARVPGPQ